MPKILDEDLELIEDSEGKADIEMPKKAKRVITEYQRANLEKGRQVRKERGEAQRKADQTLLASKVTEKEVKKEKEIDRKAESIVQTRTRSEPKKKRNKQVIVFQSDSDSEDDTPQIIIKRSKKKEKTIEKPIPQEEYYEPEPEPYYEPEPAPYRRMKRV